MKLRTSMAVGAPDRQVESGLVALSEHSFLFSLVRIKSKGANPCTPAQGGNVHQKNDEST